MSMIDNLLSVKEFASLLRTHASTVRRAIRDGRIHAFKIGSGKKASYRIHRTELERMMEFDLTQLIEHRANEIAFEAKKR